MTVRQERVVEIDAFGDAPDEVTLASLCSGDIVAVRVRNLVPGTLCQNLTERLKSGAATEEHADVAGLRVLGLSHFQAARDPDLRPRYYADALRSAGTLRRLAGPHASPFDLALAFLTLWWPHGCRVLRLPTEGRLAPFTVRIYGDGVGIEPHQDILAAESPGDRVAVSLTGQLGANVYLSTCAEGGALELFASADAEMGYHDLSDGPHVVARECLEKAVVTLEPSVGDLIMFASRRVHAVTASRGMGPRITISFFVGLTDETSPLEIWA